ncbi:MAG: HipA domain-containing protein, partial [Marinirhabdus sp.]
LFSNGDAHLKNFSLTETPMGDFKLSPAYDLLNSRIHIEDNDFALKDGLLPKALSQGKTIAQIKTLSEKAGINKIIYNHIVETMFDQTGLVKKLTFSSFLDEPTKKHYFQSYQKRLKSLKDNKVRTVTKTHT